MKPQSSRAPAPFSRFEWLIAWRYLRAKRAEGGVSVMTWISLIGIALAVFALIATLAVRAGFRAEFVDTILGANAHASYYSVTYLNEAGQAVRTIPDYEEVAARIRDVPGVLRAAPLVTGEVLSSAMGRNAGVQVMGIAQENLLALPRIVDPQTGYGDISRYDDGVAIGSGVAQILGISVGDQIKLISPDGAKTPFGTSPRVGVYEVVYVFSAGRWDIDRTRIYMPFTAAQDFFNRDGVADEVEVILDDPEQIDRVLPDLWQVAGPNGLFQTWKDTSGAFLRALDVEDNVMFVLLSVLVLIAAMNIVSGLIMLVKNKQADIGILRTIGLTEGSIMRIFFICGASVGVIGTLAGVVLGCLFALWIDPIFAMVNSLSGGDVWDPSVRGIYYLPARLNPRDVLTAVGLSLTLSCVVTIFPARRAARLNPVEALRHG
ncbi:lipoprotein-releasing ABC transporter permease subunit [Pseudoruegeria sp. SK021]|uniref:lipoprotein-releasing ABC transporter permease subunit n=1 Tax=Pseudoruegeria sp. SK021 TaxID=1933035 RepID=UPI000A251425|nr:lipoprotein-releasing ABC transporter permease subunit [Pseudoruegeria sp. SK021]OSP56428.1 ABC transporter substrate-binding protein [Pseudoruegeria sp. SK021]